MPPQFLEFLLEFLFNLFIPLNGPGPLDYRLLDKAQSAEITTGLVDTPHIDTTLIHMWFCAMYGELILGA